MGNAVYIFFMNVNVHFVWRAQPLMVFYRLLPRAYWKDLTNQLEELFLSLSQSFVIVIYCCE